MNSNLSLISYVCSLFGRGAAPVGSENKAVSAPGLAGYCSSKTWPFQKAKLFLVSSFVTLSLAQRNEEVLIPGLSDSGELVLWCE